MSVEVLKLIRLCKENNRLAQLQLYKQYCQAMFIVAHRYVKDSDEAEDIVQEAFINAFKNLHQYKEIVTFGAWLKRIVINKSIDFLKKRTLQTEMIEDNNLAALETTDEEPFSLEVETKIKEVKLAMTQLSEKYQCVLNLYLIEGYDHDEISSILNISNVSSRTLLSRGKLKLKELLKQ